MKWAVLTLASMLIMGAKYRGALRPQMFTWPERISGAIRRGLNIFVLSLVSAALISAGLVITVYDWFSQFDKYGVAEVSSTMWGGGTLLGLGLALSLVAYSIGFMPRPRRVVSPTKSLEDALTILLNNYVQQQTLKREFKREQQQEQFQVNNLEEYRQKSAGL